LVDFGMNDHQSDHPTACLQNMDVDKFKNKDCSSDTYMNREKMQKWFDEKCFDQESCIFSFSESQTK